jgi:hypothetical protein
MINSTISTEDLIKKNEGAHCFVALNDAQVIGVASVRVKYNSRWWARGLVAYYFCDGILPSYMGTDVFFELNKIRWEFVRKTGAKIHQFNTNEHNKVVININKRAGFKLFHFNPTEKGVNYYSVTMIKWDDGCPFPDWFVRLKFNLTRIVSKFLWKPGYRCRFLFN